MKKDTPNRFPLATTTTENEKSTTAQNPYLSLDARSSFFNKMELKLFALHRMGCTVQWFRSSSNPLPS
jgi:hypothetical protein